MEGTAGEEVIVPLGAGMRADRTSEGKLVRAAQRGSPDAIEALVRSYWPRAVRIAYVIVRDRAAAEDLAQESMLAAVRSLDRFDSGRAFAPWMHRIVTNRAIDWARANDRRDEIRLDEVPSAPAPSPSRLSDDLMAALGSLGAEDRAIVGMSHLFGFKAKEIGEILNVKPTTVRSRLSRALARLRVELGAVNQEEDLDAY